METRKLSLEQMEGIQGGKSCGKIGAVFSILGGVSGLVLIATGVGSPLGAAMLATSISTGIVGIGCGMGELMGE